MKELRIDYLILNAGPRAQCLRGSRTGCRTLLGRLVCVIQLGLWLTEGELLAEREDHEFERGLRCGSWWREADHDSAMRYSCPALAPARGTACARLQYTRTSAMQRTCRL